MAYSPDPLIHRRDGGALRRSTRRAGNNDARTPRQLRSATRTRGNRGVSDLPAGELVANAPRKKRRPARKAATRNDAQPDRRGDNEGTRTTASSRSTQRNRRAPQHSSKVDDTDERDKHDAQPDLEGDVTGAQEGGPSTEQLAAEEEFLLKFERNPDRKILRYSMAKPPADFVSLAESSNQNGAVEWCIGSAMVGHSPTRGNNRRAVSDGSMHAGTEQPPTGFNVDRTATTGDAGKGEQRIESGAGAPGPSSSAGEGGGGEKCIELDANASVPSMGKETSQMPTTSRSFRLTLPLLYSLRLGPDLTKQREKDLRLRSSPVTQALRLRPSSILLGPSTTGSEAPDAPSPVTTHRALCLLLPLLWLMLGPPKEILPSPVPTHTLRLRMTIRGIEQLEDEAAWSLRTVRLSFRPACVTFR
ncbi:LOW QUALITY PROTEIN: hypothetical protein ACHAXT_002666 [Thalassiosira profunda]